MFTLSRHTRMLSPDHTGDYSRRIRRHSPFSATVTKFGDCCRKRRLLPNSATVVASVDRALQCQNANLRMFQQQPNFNSYEGLRAQNVHAHHTLTGKSQCMAKTEKTENFALSSSCLLVCNTQRKITTLLFNLLQKKAIQCKKQIQVYMSNLIHNIIPYYMKAYTMLSRT